MTKRIFYLIFFIFTLIPKANAQFIGYYNLHDGGVDVPSSSLFIMADNQFLLSYMSGYKLGTWKENNENSIALTEKRYNSQPIKITGEVYKNSSDLFIDVEGLVNAHAFISFSKDTVSAKEFQPVFNDWTNCADKKYVIKKKVGEYNWVTIAISPDPDFRQRRIRFPYKVKTYTFPLGKTGGKYFIKTDKDALMELMTFTLTKDEDVYQIDGSDVKMRRKDMSVDETIKVKNALKNIERNAEAEKLKYSLPCVAISSVNVFKSKQPPIFVAKCENDTETSDDEVVEEDRVFKSTDKSDGFYAVLDFDENASVSDNYNLAKEPGITKEDIYSYQKVISDFGGYDIEIVLTEKGKAKFEKFTKDNMRKPIAIIFNKQIVSTPFIFEEIKNGKIAIGGDLPESQIDKLIVSFKDK